MPTIELHLDVLSDFSQTACVFEKSSVFGKNPKFLSYKILCGSVESESSVSPNDYFNGLEDKPARNKVLFIHVFRGCGINVEIFDRRLLTSGSSISDDPDKTYLPIIVKVLEEAMRSTQHGFFATDIICAAMDKNRAGKMKEEVFAPFHHDHYVRGSTDDLAAKRALGLSDITSTGYNILKKNRKGQSSEQAGRILVIRPQSYTASMGLSDDPFIPNYPRQSDILLRSHEGLKPLGGAGMHQSTNPMTNPELYHSSAAIQRVRGSGMASEGLSNGGLEGAGMHQITNPMADFEFYHSFAAFQMDRGSGLASQGPSNSGLEGAGMHQITNPMADFELYHSFGAFQRDRGSGLASEGLSNGGLEGAGMHQITNPMADFELYHSFGAFQRDRGSGLASEGLSNGGLEGAGMHQITNPMADFELYHSFAAFQRDRGSGLASEGLSNGGLEGGGMHQITNPMTDFEFYPSFADFQRDRGSRLASQGLPDGALKDQVLQGADIHKTYPTTSIVPLEIVHRGMYSPSISLGVSDGLYDGGRVGLSQQGAGTHQISNPMMNPELYHSPATIQRDRGSRLASQGLSDGAFEGQMVQGAGIHRTNTMTSFELSDSSASIERVRDSRLVSQGVPDGNLIDKALQGAVIHMTHPVTCFNSLTTLGRAIFSSLASLGVSLEDLESQGADIPVLERMCHLLSEHNRSAQQWLRDAGTVGASFSAVYASPSLTTQLPAAVACTRILTAMWLPRKCRGTQSILTKFGAIACLASVMSAMVNYLSPVGMGIAGAVLLIPAGVVVFG